ncbi:MAG: YqaA family protein [Pseudomonadota bacterium]
MLRRMYDTTLALADSRYALWLLAVVAFVESSVFPIPPDVLMIPMILAAPHRAWLIAGICTVASVLGGAFGYWIGATAWEEFARPVLEFYGKSTDLSAFQVTYNEYGSLIVLFSAVTPFPYKVITILSGVLSLDFANFMFASLIGRGARFFIVAALLWKFGPPIKAFIEERLGLMFTLAMALLIGGFAAIRFL